MQIELVDPQRADPGNRDRYLAKRQVASSMTTQMKTKGRAARARLLGRWRSRELPTWKMWTPKKDASHLPKKKNREGGRNRPVGLL